MRYGKLINNTVQYMKQPFKIDGLDVFTNDETIIREQGYKSVIKNAQPEHIEGHHWECAWVETDDAITLEWSSIEDPVVEDPFEIIDTLTGEVE